MHLIISFSIQPATRAMQQKELIIQNIKLLLKMTISRKLWPSKGRYKTAVLTKSEVQKQFPNYFWFEPPVIPFNVPLIATSLTENIEQK